VKETENEKNLQEIIYNDKNSNNEHSDTSLDPSNCHENLIDPEYALVLLHAASNKQEMVKYQKEIEDLTNERDTALAKIQILEEKNYENSDKVKETENEKNLQEIIYNDKNSNNEHSDTSLDPSNCHENLIDPEYALVLLHAASNKPESSQQKKISDLSSNILTNSFASEDIDRNGSTENLTVTNPPVSEDSNKNVPSKNLIVPTENLIVTKSPASEHFEKNGSTANLIENHDKLQKKQNGSKPILKIKCQRCDHKFKSNFHLNVHNKLSNGIGIPMKCTQCNKTYCTAKSLKEHEKIPEVKKPMKCDICEYTFDSDKKMADHKKSVHAEMTQYESNICDTSFDKKKIAIHEKRIV